jgi:hypothetical protein
VTGIQRNFIDDMLARFNPRRMGDFQNNRNFNVKVIHHNNFWTCIEASSDETAASLKKYLRNEKKIMD